MLMFSSTGVEVSVNGSPAVPSDHDKHAFYRRVGVVLFMLFPELIRHPVNTGNGRFLWTHRSKRMVLYNNGAL